ncbi:MAG TPA: polyphosphate kinase 2 family protein [Terriglobales bacterium]|nr:polyphosphate kinase 2 family protein [Terriglobales bacterium]
MDLSTIREHSRKLCSRYRITDGKKFQLSDVDPDDIAHLKKSDKQEANEALTVGVEALAELQNKLYAQHRWGVLIILQGIDAAGKDGVIKHVMSGVNPQGCDVHSFKAPSAEELAHDYLWRCQTRLPQRGHIGIFNRSYYEEVIVVRVHPEFLAAQSLPPQVTGKNIWKQRYQQINNFERHLTESGYLVLKFFLHLSKDEQKKRFMERLDDPNKNWKFSLSDASERQHWDEYTKAYEKMIRATATDHAPWYVVPADNKWFTRVTVAATLIHEMNKLDLAYPTLDDAKLADLAKARKALIEE